MEKIEKLAYDEVKRKLAIVSDCNKGAYFHGWFDCLYFISKVMDRDDKGVGKVNER